MKYTFIESSSCNMCNSGDMVVLGKRLNQSQGFSPASKLGITTSVAKCKNCGLKFANPMPIPDSVGAHYDLEIDEYFGQHDNLISESAFDTEVNYFKSLASDRGKLRGLDIGAGLGGIMKAMERNGIEAYGLEPSESFYDFAIDKMGIAREKLTNGSMEYAQYEEDSFDFIVFNAVFEHLYNPNEAIRKALTWLKKGGVIYIGVPYAYSLNQVLINLYYRLRGLDYVSNISPMHPPFHLYEFTENAFRKNAILNDYTIHKVERVTYRTYLPKSLDFLILPVIKLTRTEMNIIVWITKN